eukprot:5642506-Pleurochrysis_carterae.AAC.2
MWNIISAKRVSLRSIINKLGTSAYCTSIYRPLRIGASADRARGTRRFPRIAHDVVTSASAAVCDTYPPSPGRWTTRGREVGNALWARPAGGGGALEVVRLANSHPTG